MLTLSSLPPRVTEALSRLRERGYEAYLVGGSVRDLLRGTEPGDYDVAVSALPEQTKEVFSGQRIVETGIRHGTVTVLFDGFPLEITTFRTESGYSDCRHPDSVAFTRSLREDLARRDFTVNAIAWSPDAGVIDPFGGEKDLESRVIRCVGDPETRFSEDALRILRGARFASVLDFSLEKETARAMHECREKLRSVSPERICAELKKLLCGIGAERVLREFRDLIAVFLPELEPCFDFPQISLFHLYDVWEHTLRVVKNVPAKPTIRLAALLHDVGKPLCCTREGEVTHFGGHPKKSAEMAEAMLRRLHAEREVIEEVKLLILYHDRFGIRDRSSLAELLNALTPEQCFSLFALMESDNLAKSPLAMRDLPGIREGRKLLQSLLDEGVPLSVRELAVGGEDLLALGFVPGKEMGECLSALLRAVWEGKLPNRAPELLAEARKRKKRPEKP